MSDLACRDIRELLGVYVVGAIEPADRAITEEHLSQCRWCREELAGLATLPSLLRRVPLADAEQMAASALTEDGEPATPQADAGAGVSSLLDKVAARRRSRRLRAIVAAAAAVLVVAGGSVAISQQLGTGGQVPPSADVAVGHSGQRTAWVSYEGAAWGTEMWVRAAGIKPGTTCTFWLKDKAGHRWADGSWTVRPGTAGTWYPAATSVPKAQVAAFQITSGGKVLVTVPATS